MNFSFTALIIFLALIGSSCGVNKPPQAPGEAIPSVLSQYGHNPPPSEEDKEKDENASVPNSSNGK